MIRYIKLWIELLGVSWRRFPGQTGAMFLVKLLAAGAVSATAVALKHATDSALQGDAQGALVAAAIAALTYGLVGYLEGVDTYLHFLLVEKVALIDLQMEIDRSIATMEGLDHLERTDYLDRVTVVRNAPWGIMFGLWVAVDTVFNILQLVIMLAVLGSVSPWLMLLLLFAGVPLWFERRGLTLVNDAETETAELFRVQRHLFDLATDAATSKEVRVAGAGEECTRIQSRAWDEMVEGRYRARVRSAFWQVTGWIIFTAGFTGGIGLVVYQAANGTGTIGDIILTITVAVNLRAAVQNTVARTAETAGAGMLIDPFLWLRDYTAADRARAKGVLPPPETLREGLRLDHVSYTYPGTTSPALDDVTVSFPAGSVVAIVGEYGSGKTTLVKLLSKFYLPDQGQISVDGTPLVDINTEAWRARSSAAFQDFGRFQTVFAETVGLGDLDRIEDRERISWALAFADAQSLVDRLPDGLDTQLGRSLGGVDLSEGQWQKTALARSAMREAPLLFILDEPTASLDAPSENAIFRRYMQRARDLAARTGAVTVVVSHRFSTVAGADLILVLDQGRVIESGTHEELLDAGGRYAEVYNMQAAASM
ncbi:ABC transporter ATP-binding protein [Micromonospora sp. FIMYZ51]|uniref:ABC transporter ATP-binding protein n=1 Tax=Micromonospora sp. FIMYZ51 TaxID=3051832 RepID=UPI00311EC1EA